MTPLTKREVPDGFTTEWDNTTWNVGFTFMWSDVYQGYLRCGQITVKPGDTLPEAWERVMNEPMWPEYEIFFVEGR
jgi:hypothetical protein